MSSAAEPGNAAPDSALPTFEFAALATVLILLMFTPNTWALRGAMGAAAIAVLMWRPLLHSRHMWLLFLSLSGAGLYFSLETSDNHKFLLVYWLLAIFVALHSSNVRSALATSSRYMIALTMGFAVYHKAISPDYLSGEFFQHELLFDPRFQGIAERFGGLDASVAESNKLNLNALRNLPGHGMDVVQFHASSELRWLALVLTWTGFMLEASVAVFFLVPLRLAISRYRDFALLCFLVVVYPVATVLGFGYTLAAMGMAQAESVRKVYAYAVTLVLLQLYAMPWRVLL